MPPLAPPSLAPQAKFGLGGDAKGRDGGAVKWGDKVAAVDALIAAVEGRGGARAGAGAAASAGPASNVRAKDRPSARADADDDDDDEDDGGAAGAGPRAPRNARLFAGLAASGAGPPHVAFGGALAALRKGLKDSNAAVAARSMAALAVLASRLRGPFGAAARQVRTQSSAAAVSISPARPLARSPARSLVLTLSPSLTRPAPPRPAPPRPAPPRPARHSPRSCPGCARRRARQ